MKKQAIVAVSSAALLFSLPAPALADAKDAIVGGIIGGLVGGAMQKQHSKKQAKKKVSRAAPSLNSQYSRNERIQIQSALRDQGYPIGTVDGILGRNSRAAIRMYQSSLGEAQTGQLTPAQFARLTGVGGNQFAQPQVVNRPLGPAEVALMQQSLQRLGYYRGPVDGIDGPGTRNAVAGYLGGQGLNPMGLTNVQALVTVASAAGFAPPPYLIQEANAPAGFGAPQQPFGAPQTQQAFGQSGQQPFGGQQQPFGTPPPNQNFGQQPNQGFAAPQTQQVFGQQPSATFGTPQQGQIAPGTAPVFGGQQAGTIPQGQQPMMQHPNQLGAQPQGQQPQAGQGTPLFASGNSAVQQDQQQMQQVGVQTQQPLFAPQAGGQQALQVAPQQQQSTLDVFAPNTTEASAPLSQQQSTFGATNN